MRPAGEFLAIEDFGNESEIVNMQERMLLILAEPNDVGHHDYPFRSPAASSTFGANPVSIEGTAALEVIR